jgi:hypothetical protein
VRQVGDAIAGCVVPIAGHERRAGRRAAVARGEASGDLRQPTLTVVAVVDDPNRLAERAGWISVAVLDEGADLDPARLQQAAELVIGQTQLLPAALVPDQGQPVVVVAQNDAAVVGVGGPEQTASHLWARRVRVALDETGRTVGPDPLTRVRVVPQLVPRTAALSRDEHRAPRIPFVPGLVTVAMGTDHDRPRGGLTRRTGALEPHLLHIAPTPARCACAAGGGLGVVRPGGQEVGAATGELGVPRLQDQVPVHRVDESVTVALTENTLPQHAGRTDRVQRGLVQAEALAGDNFNHVELPIRIEAPP